MGILGKLRPGGGPYVSAVVLAAGSSERMGGINKLFADIGGRSVLARSLDAMDACGLINEIVLVVNPGDIETTRTLYGGVEKLSAVVLGGETRLHSSFNGVRACSRHTDFIAVHDAARPLVTQRVIVDTIELARKSGAAVPSLPVVDTLKHADRGTAAGTPDRNEFVAVQTPQVFDADLLLVALKKAVDDGADITDDSTAVERTGAVVHFSRGDRENIKITTPVDLVIAGAILALREKESGL